MKTPAMYLLQMIACSGILYSYYHFFLRNKKFHQYNRYYLLTATFISLIIPFLKIPVYISGAGNSVQKVLLDYNYYIMPEVIVISSSKSSLINWEWMLMSFYAAVALFFMWRICTSVVRIIKLKLRNPSEKLNDILFIETHENDAPFSFFNWVFWNNKIDTFSDEGRQIMKHEIYHVNQKHSFDILFMEIVSSILWVNPIYHLMKKEIKAIHEFLADEYAAGTDEKLEYAEILVLQAIGNCRQTLVNPFFNNQLKRRINMLTTNKKSTHQYLRKILVLPLLAIVAVLFIISCKSSDEKTEKAAHDSIVTEVPKSTFDSSSAGTNNPLPDSISTAVDPGVLSKVDIDAAYPGGASAWKGFLERNLRGETPVEHGAKQGTYTTIIQFIVDKDGNVSDIKPLTKVGYGMEEEAVRVISKSGKWKPAIANGKEVRAYRKQPVTFMVVEDGKS